MNALIAVNFVFRKMRVQGTKTGDALQNTDKRLSSVNPSQKCLGVLRDKSSHRELR